MSSSQGSSALRLTDIAVTYPNGFRALEPMSLDVAPGEFLVLLGASGAGKSTLLRSINGLVRPSAGRIDADGLAGRTVTRRNLAAHRRACAMVFQQHHLIGRQTALANVLMGKLASRGSLAGLLPWRREDKLQALAALERVGVADKALVRADSLSGGQQQRVGIARALIQKPRVLLADEPVASLDPASARTVLTLLHDICKKDRLTAVVSLHQIEFAREFADRIVGMRQGRMVFEGLPHELTPQVQADLYAKPPVRTEEPGALAPVPSFSPSSVSSKEFSPC